MPNPVDQTPKDRFMQSGTRVSEHRELVSSASFEKSADAALLQFINQKALTINDMNGAAAVGLQIAGAVQFLNTFKGLAENPPARAIRPNDNLNARA